LNRYNAQIMTVPNPTTTTITGEIIDAFPWPSILLDDAGNVIHVNTPALEASGLRRVPAGGAFETLFPDFDRVLQGDPRWATTQEAPLSLFSGSEEVHLRLYVRRLSRGSLIVLCDETPMRRMELRSAQTVRLASLGFMLAGVCHEVSNPLAATYSMVQILQSRVQTDDAILKRGLDAIASNVRRILEVSSRVSEFSRVSEECHVFAVDHAIDEALALLIVDGKAALLGELKNGEVGLGGISIRRQQNPAARVSGRVHELRQVFFNILLNSMQALGGHGEVRIEVDLIRSEADAEGTVVATIEDSGPGIPEEYLDRVFEPFFSTKAGNQGSGLGLAISYELALEHGGGLSVQNQPAGGACFRLELPLALEGK
jgi:two-component system, NtrC family, sensor kinase